VMTASLRTCVPLLPRSQGIDQYSHMSRVISSSTTRWMPLSLWGNPFGPTMGCLERTIADDDAHVEWQVSPDEGDDVDNGDDPLDIPQPESKDIAQPELEDIAQPEVPALPMLKENEVWTIGMFRPINM
jgi:hypothetical protein